MQGHRKAMEELNNLFSDLVIVGFSKNIVKKHIKTMEKTDKPVSEEQCKKQIEMWESETLTVENQFYEFCKKNKTEYYENKEGVEVFRVNTFYFCFTFGKDMLFSIEFNTFKKYFPTKLAEIKR